MARTILERSDLIPALAEIFRTHGYEGTSIGIIVEITGAGRSSLYHFFPGGKEEMAAAVLDHIRAWFDTHIFTPLDELTPEEGIAAMADAASEYFRSGQSICLVGAFALDRTRDQFADRVSGYFAHWLTALAGSLQRGGLTPQDAQAEAAHLVATLQGSIILSRATGEHAHFRQAISAIRQRFATES